MKLEFRTNVLILGAAGLAIALALAAEKPATEKAHKLTMISPRKMADALHAVIAADREAYLRLVVVPWSQAKHSTSTSERPGDGGELPVHAQLLRHAGVTIATRGAEFSYALRSPWPINPSHGPQTDAEREGMRQLQSNPGANVYTEELLGGRSYFTAIYPDRAILPSCVECHNLHAASPRHDFKTNELMGAIVVRVPLEF